MGAGGSAGVPRRHRQCGDSLGDREGGAQSNDRSREHAEERPVCEAEHEEGHAHPTWRCGVRRALCTPSSLLLSRVHAGGATVTAHIGHKSTPGDVRGTGTAASVRGGDTPTEQADRQEPRNRRWGGAERAASASSRSEAPRTASRPRDRLCPPQGDRITRLWASHQLFTIADYFLCDLCVTYTCPLLMGSALQGRSCWV